MKPVLVFATNNANKAKEVAALFQDYFEIRTLNEVGFSKDIPETGSTLNENARIKAAAVYEETGYSCFADDTGLLVDALNGRPGVYSARYAGPNATAEENNSLLLNELLMQENRSAAFVTVICLCIQGAYTFFEGRLEGAIATEPCGSGGFGYDPLFVPEGESRTLAQMTLSEKNTISHRARAFRKMLDAAKAF